MCRSSSSIHLSSIEHLTLLTTQDIGHHPPRGTKQLYLHRLAHPQIYNHKVIIMGHKHSKPDQKRKSREDTFSAMKLDDLECQKCKQIYREPRILECAHTFCYDCCVLEGGKITCTLCSKETVIESKSQLKINNFVQRQIEIASLLLSDKNAHILSKAAAKGSLRGPNTI